MYRFRRSAALAVCFLFLATPCMADSDFQTVFKDAFYGGLTGGLVGAAVLAFTTHPGRHLDYIGYGAAGGVLVGAAYGVVTTTRSLAELDHGRVKFAMPTIMPELRESNVKGRSYVVATAELFRGKF